MAASYFQRLQDESKKFFQTLSLTQKVVLGSVSLALIGVTIFVLSWAAQPQWAVLYRDLSSQDAGAIIAQLKDANTPYQIKQEQGGTLILVSQQSVHELRLQMAAQDLPKEGGVVGFELFDKAQMGMTNHLFNLNYQRALAGELARTVMGLDGIDKARVHLAIPKKQLFSDLDESPTASVTLKLRRGYTLKEAQVEGISKLVSRSVPGLSHQDVTITDTLGNVLFDRDFGSAAGKLAHLSQGQLSLQRTVETQIRKDVKSILMKVVGADHINVQVKAKLDFDKEETESKQYTPNANQNASDLRAVRSEKKIKESSVGKRVSPQGVPGVTSNTPSYQENATDASNTFVREDNVKNYEVPEIKTHRVKAPGQIQRLALSVAINSSAPLFQASTELGATEAQILSRLKSLAMTAAGIDLKRGDSVAVHKVAFDDSENKAWEEAVKDSEQKLFWQQILQYGLLGLLIFLMLFALFLISRRQKQREPRVDFLADDDVFALPETPENLALTQAAVKRAQTVSNLAVLAEDDPARVARLLRAWMSD